eukprot:scaffold112483_cov14-Prasinocladus_malaysianus.AAC.1
MELTAKVAGKCLSSSQFWGYNNFIATCNSEAITLAYVSAINGPIMWSGMATIFKCHACVK